jgi:hypothetical protein
MGMIISLHMVDQLLLGWHQLMEMKMIDEAHFNSGSVVACSSLRLLEDEPDIQNGGMLVYTS